MTTTRSDCGCSDTAEVPSTVKGKPAATMTVPGAGTAGVANAPVATGTVVLDGFRGLNPTDGLFLRAEHLTLIQDYARSLASALATAGGAGVVHGLAVRLVGSELEVSPGLAISPHGRLLLLTSTIRLPLDAAHVPPRTTDGFWRVELHWATGTSGSAPVYGSLCNDSCADGGATIQPLREEGVELRLVTDSLPGLDGVPLARRHNWLASAYFERERASGQPWLVPVGVGNPVSLWSHDWEDGTPLPGEAGVPLGLVQLITGDYDLDVWAARRLVDGPAAGAAWRERLAMRPWAIFLAQILQFEAEITGVTLLEPDAAPAAAADVTLAAFYQDTAKGLLGETQRFFEAVKLTDPVRARGYFQRLEEAVQKVADSPMATAPKTSVASQLGIDELPPGGFLNVHSTPERLEGDLVSFFGPNVDLRLRRLRADQVADEVLAAQSRDRIPLEPLEGRRPRVDILVPAEPADKAELYTAAYGWVAFVRRGPQTEAEVPTPPPAQETENVEVYILFDNDWPRLAKEFSDADLKNAQRIDVGTLTFPKGDWAYPGGKVATKTLDGLTGTAPLALFALTRGEDRPLAAVRAGLFGTSLDSGDPLPVYALANKPVEAIVVIAEIRIN